LIKNDEFLKSHCFHCRQYNLPIGEKTYVMGILNVTPDSFSDGGSYKSVEEAIKKAHQMVLDGADIIDIGGESTRPGFVPVDADEEVRRIITVISRLKSELNVPVSVDTTKAVVAEKALAAGADIINDIWGLQKDPDMAKIVAEYDAGVIVMHNSSEAVNGDIMGDVNSFLRKSIRIAEKFGIPDQNIVIDPGIGFGKTHQQNLEVMRRLKELRSIGIPVLLGTSRKSLIGNVLELPVDERIEGTAATVAIGIANGVDFIRIHDVKEMVRVSKMTDAMLRG
jgi:dihydropteroate synthase